MTTHNGQHLTTVDYDLHGIVGIRLLDATLREVDAVSRQLGPIRSQLSRDPDVVIRFVDRLHLSTPMRYLGVDDAGFTDDAFFLLRGKHKARVRVRIPFAQIGQRCEIVCERGLLAVPLLIAIVNMTALNKGALPMHASAFRYNGVGVLATGWSKGGKTETLLAFAARGAEYIGDEWVYISQDGQSMYGIPEPIRIWDWHLTELPEFWAKVQRSDRARLRALRFMVDSVDQAAVNGRSRGAAPVRMMGRVTPLLKQQLYVQMPPQTLFGQESRPSVCSLDKLLFVASHETADVTVQPIEGEEIARRMLFSLQEERMDLLSAYFKFRFAFPDVRNELIEQSAEIQRTLLSRVLASKEAYAVFHPYPVSIPSLYDAISPLLAQGPRASVVKE